MVHLQTNREVVHHQVAIWEDQDQAALEVHHQEIDQVVQEVLHQATDQAVQEVHHQVETCQEALHQEAHQEETRGQEPETCSVIHSSEQTTVVHLP